MMFVAVVVLVAVVIAVPAMARDGRAFDGNAFAPFNSDTFNRVFEGFYDGRGNNSSPVDNHNNNNLNNRFNDPPSVNQAVGQESQSGNVKITGSAPQSGNNSNQCVTPLQFGNTGSLQNTQGVLQYGSTSGDIELGGSSFEFSPSLNAKCDQKVQQSSVASG
jgi:hypothetical protein